MQKQGQLDEYTTAKKGELDSHTTQKKNELNTHEKAKEKELDNYVTTVNKPELDKYTNIKKEELNSHTKTKESEITQVTETKKQEITAHGASELGKFGQGAKQEADKQIGRVVAEGDIQVQRVKDESGGVIPRIEKLESGKVSKSGDTIKGMLVLDGPKRNQLEIKSNGKSIAQLVADDTSAALYVFDKNGGYGHQLIITNEGNTTLPAKNLTTKNAEVISAINELNSGKVSKNGDTIDGILYANRFFVKDGDMKGGMYYGSDNRIILNNTKGGAVSLFDDGTTKIAAKNLNTSSKEVISAVNELNSKKSDLTGSTFTGLVAVKKDTNGEAMVALNSAYGNGDIYSGGSAKGVGFKNRTSGKGLFLGDDGSVKLEASNLPTTSKDLAGAFTEVISNNQKMVGVSDSVVYIQDVGEKKAGKGYIDKVTKEVYVCMVTNTDTDIKLGKFELATNVEVRNRIAKIEEILGIYQPVFNITELSVSRDENVSATTLTYTQK